MEDMNRLIGLATQMGLVHGIFDQVVRNATKCATWQDIQASHTASGGTVVVELDNTYGILSLLGIGLAGSLVIFLAEVFIAWVKVKLNNSAI